MKLDEKDIKLLKELQNNCKQSLKELARKLDMKITTAYDRIKKLENDKIIKGYTAIIDGEKIGVPVTAFIFIRFHYYYPEEEILSQEEVAKKISFLPGVQEVHIIPGEWDMLVKVKGKDVKQIGLFVIDQLRRIRGIERTLTADAWVSAKESPEIDLNLLKLK